MQVTPPPLSVPRPEIKYHFEFWAVPLPLPQRSLMIQKCTVHSVRRKPPLSEFVIFVLEHMSTS